MVLAGPWGKGTHVELRGRDRDTQPFGWLQPSRQVKNAQVTAARCARSLWSFPCQGGTQVLGIKCLVAQESCLGRYRVFNEGVVGVGRQKCSYLPIAEFELLVATATVVAA